MGTTHERVTGTVQEWHNDEGWGVLLTPDGLTVWCHYSDLVMDGYRTLAPGSSVTFDYETPGQDGYDGRVFTAVHPA